MINFNSGLLGYTGYGGYNSLRDIGKSLASRGINRFKKNKNNPIDTTIGFNRNVNLLKKPLELALKSEIGLNRGNILPNLNNGFTGANNSGIGINRSRYAQSINNLGLGKGS